MRRLRHLPLHLLVVFGLFFAACGDDDGGDTSADDASADTDDASEEDAEDAAEDAIGASGGGDCGFLAEFAGAMEDFDPTEAMGSGESLDFGGFYGELAGEFQEVADAAPAEIEDAFQTLAATMDEVAETLEGVELDFSDPENVDPEALAALDSLDTAFDEEFEAASDEIDVWIRENCGDFADEFDLDDVGGGGGLGG